jgi:hypothetical protein
MLRKRGVRRKNASNGKTQNLDVSEFVRLAVLPKVYHLA